jgi:hypothetical protein
MCTGNAGPTARLQGRRPASAEVRWRAVPRWQERYAIACSAIIGWSLAYGLASWSRWTRLVYDPLSREWSWRQATYSPTPIDYWGLLAWGLGGAVVGAAIAVIGARLWRRALPRVVQTLLGAWAVTAFLYAGTYFTWMLWPF